MMRKIKHDALAMTEYGDNPAAVVVGDSEASRNRGREWGEKAGCRVSDVMGIEGAADRLDRQVAMDAVILEIENDPGVELDRLLKQVDAGANAGRFGSVVTAPPSLIDRIFAGTAHKSIIHLCDPTEADRMIAIVTAASRSPERLHDIGKGTARLQQLSEEVGRIANILASLSEEEEPGEGPSAKDEEDEAALNASTLRALIRARRLREQYFHAEWFADPAWDMLLDLMAARLDRQRVAVSSLCIAAAVPATTALRWIKTLTDHGLFVRVADPQDGRRVFIELSDKAAAQLGAYLQAVQRISPLVI